MSKTVVITAALLAGLQWMVEDAVESGSDRITEGGYEPEDRLLMVQEIDQAIEFLAEAGAAPEKVAYLKGRTVNQEVRDEIERDLVAKETTAQPPRDPMAGLLPITDSDVVTEATFYGYAPSADAALALARVVFVDKVERIEEIVLGGQPAYLVVTEAAALAALNADEATLIEQARAHGYTLFWSMGTAYAAPLGVSTSNNISGRGWIYGGAALVDAARAALLHAKRPS